MNIKPEWVSYRKRKNKNLIFQDLTLNPIRIRLLTASETWGLTRRPGRPEQKKVGNEIDLIIGYKGIENNLELALALDYFIPDKAFPHESKNSILTKLVIEFEF